MLLNEVQSFKYKVSFIWHLKNIYVGGGTQLASYLFIYLFVEAPLL
ncbi:MAG: hypothetical protein ACI8RD_000541 [Bacillariaceae sp.]|jgi:hypothetical protein